MRYITAVTPVFLACALVAAASAADLECPQKNITYWQAVPPGGEADISARHQQMILKRKCPMIETIVMYKPGASGALMWSQMNTLPGDGHTIVGVALPQIVLQPLQGDAQYKTRDITPVYFFRYMPDAIIVPEASPIKTFKDLVTMAKMHPKEVTVAGSGTYSQNNVAQERLNAVAGIQTTYVPFKGTGDMTTSVIGGHVTAAMAYSAFAINNKGRVRALAVAMEKRSPLLPDVPTFRELGIDWVDGAYGGIGVPKSTPPEVRKRVSDLWAALNSEPELRDLESKSGFEVVDIDLNQMDEFMQNRMKVYSEVAKRMGLIP